MEFIFDNLSATYPLYQILRRELHSIRHVHMSTNNLYPSAQSSYRKNHSTETALLKVKNDILLNMNRQHTTFLVLLDLSAAFDTVDHGIMLKRLSSKLHLCDTALDWFQWYLCRRSQHVSVRGSLSEEFEVDCGVPQGSCVGPLLFTIYASELFNYHLSKDSPTRNVDLGTWLGWNPGRWPSHKSSSVVQPIWESKQS